MSYSPSSSTNPSAVLLVGFMGCGKTTVGECLAQRLAWRFIDLDKQIEQAEGLSIAEIFAQAGETPFRRKEHEYLRRILEETSQPGGWVVALGGGTFVLVTNRPLFRDEASFRRLYQERLPYYRQATFTVDTGKADPNEVVNRILALAPFQGSACCT
jgi:shikimate kinase